ncbi:multi-sensor hybrid histidine kinase [Plesiocystis pacifica SIR-1]|uniref:histidine kinase n=1 Tax=Plesiocystis pacifica SIR-1 TaxID=391625 RepID=A6FXR6_9BACT|nr:ATP-binding protein [Plesiocystis pacifica]EDM81654.1 multi-sensor hybrid histidine kinase [Plesiocystis pacifica SIR-1]
MADVHNRVLRACVSATEQLIADGDPRAWIEQAGLEEYLVSGERVPWDKMARFFDLAREAAGSREAMIEVGRKSNRRGVEIEAHPLEPLLRGLMTVRRLYRLSFRIQHRTAYPFMSMRYSEAEAGVIDLRIRVPEPYRGCLALFEALTGQLESLPDLLGQPESRVEATIDARGGHWRIHVPEQRWLVVRAWEALRLRLSQRRIRGDVELELDVLERQHARLAAAYAELEQQSRALGREVEERERVERERQELERALVHNQRLELVGQMTGGIAHDFNNLLQVISASAEELELELEVGGEPAPGREHLAEIEQAVAAARALCRQLLGFSRSEPEAGMGAPPRVELSAALPGVIRLLRRVLPRGLVLDAALIERPSWVALRPVELQQILLNLVVNARDATIEAQAEDGRIAVRVCAETPGWVALEVEDGGVGMDEATRRAIFEPFFTTKSEGRGTGLGLTIVLGLVERAGGRVEVRSRVGEGTIFRVELPRLEGDPGA